MHLTTFLFLLIIKHAIADYYLQTYHRNVHKQVYFGNGHRHYAEHSVCTFVVCLFFISPPMAVLAALLDYVCHWHIDWAKTSIVKKIKWQRNEPRFWRIQTLDQILHFSTYFLIVWLFQSQL